MPPQSSMSESHAQRHLLDLRELRVQVREATSALATGRAAELLDRLAMLELGCAAFRRSFEYATTMAGSPSRYPGETPGLAKQFRDEHLELARSNYLFSALLRRRRRSVELLLRHYQSLSRELGPGSEPLPVTRRISAEA